MEWLLHPVTEDDFFDTYWELRPLFIAKEEPGYFGGLPSLDWVDELITATTSGDAQSTGSGYLVRTRPNGGQDRRAFRTAVNGLPDIQDVYRAYDEGYTVVLNRLHLRSAPVAALCRALEADLHHPVGANMYLTPQNGQGFRPHIDTHDVFILQLHGEKEWHVDGNAGELPLARTRHNDVEVRPGYQNLVLRPGDALYIPRGTPHEAMTSSSSSLHLTVGVHVYRWVDLLNEAVALLAEERLTFRQALPRALLDTPLDQLRLSAIAAEVSAALIDEGIAERAKARLGARLRMDAMVARPGHFRSIDRIKNITCKSIVTRAASSLCRVRTTADEALIEFATNYVAGPLIVEPALKFIAEHEHFAVNDLPGSLSGQDKLDLVGRLISEGLLYLYDSAAEVHR
jgi:ribosomal protein L16 Arg81 hydroxylase